MPKNIYQSQTQMPNKTTLIYKRKEKKDGIKIESSKIPPEMNNVQQLKHDLQKAQNTTIKINGNKQASNIQKLSNLAHRNDQNKHQEITLTVGSGDKMIQQPVNGDNSSKELMQNERSDQKKSSVGGGLNQSQESKISSQQQERDGLCKDNQEQHSSIWISKSTEQIYGTISNQSQNSVQGGLNNSQEQKKNPHQKNTKKKNTTKKDSLEIIDYSSQSSGDGFCKKCRQLPIENDSTNSNIVRPIPFCIKCRQKISI